MEWEKIFSNGVTDKDLIPQNINSLYNLTTKATQLKKWAEDLIRHSSEEDIQMANKQTRCSVSIISRETQIKTTMRYHFTPVRMAIIRKSTNNQCWRGCGEMGTLLHCWWGCKLVQLLWKTVWRSLKKLEIELPDDSAVLLGRYPDKTIIKKDICTPMFIAALLTIVKIGKQPYCPSTEEWVKQKWHIRTMKYCLAVKIEIMPFAATRLQLEMIILSSVKSERDKYCMMSLICRI